MRASHFRAKLGCFLCFPPVMPLQDPRLGCWGGLVRGNQVSVGLVLYVWDECGIDETEDWCLGYVMFVDGVCCSFLPVDWCWCLCSGDICVVWPRSERRPVCLTLVVTHRGSSLSLAPGFDFLPVPRHHRLSELIIFPDIRKELGHIRIPLGHTSASSRSIEQTHLSQSHTPILPKMGRHNGSERPTIRILILGAPGVGIPCLVSRVRTPSPLSPLAEHKPNSPAPSSPQCNTPLNTIPAW